MALLTSDKILKLVPSLFEIDLNSGVNIFRKLEKILIFDEGFIYYANPDSLQLKYSYKNHSNYDLETTFKLNTELKKFIFSKNGKLCGDNDNLIETIELKGSRQKSYIISKIFLKSTVFGIIVLSKREENFYSEEDLSILDAISAILSYLLKDVELANVFKIQLQALKDGIVEKNNAYKTIKEQN